MKFAEPPDSIIIFGAAGFVAQSLMPLLHQVQPRRLVVVDERPMPQGFLDQVSLAPNAVEVFRMGELPDLDGLVVCLAGATSVDAALADPAPAIRTNVDIAVAVGEWLRRWPLRRRALYMSSDEVLGPSTRPLSATSAFAPSQPYAVSKAMAEMVMRNYAEVFGVHVSILRSCNLVGPRQQPPKLIPVAVRCLLAGEPVPVQGSGFQQREWMSVDDLCRAIVSLIAAGEDGIYQAATGVHLSVIKVIEIVASALELAPRMTLVPDRLVQDQCYCMDASTMREIGWLPTHDPVAAIRAAAKGISESLRHGT